MRISTPYRISEWFYIGLNTTATDPGDEQFGLSVGRLYLGRYCDGWCSGILTQEGTL